MRDPKAAITRDAMEAPEESHASSIGSSSGTSDGSFANSDHGSLASSNSLAPPCWILAADEEPHPMNTGTYYHVLRFLGKITDEQDDDDRMVLEEKPARRNSGVVLHMRRRLTQDFLMVKDNVEREFTHPEVALRQDLALNKAQWYGEWGKDLWLFLLNNHPFLALFFSHRLHPISRFSRWCAFGLQFLLIVFLSCAVTEGGSCLYCGIRDCSTAFTCDVDPREEEQFAETTWMKLDKTNYCCSLRAVWILWFLETFGRFGGTLYIVILNCVFSIGMFQLIMCLCVQQRGPRVRESGELLGKMVLILVAAVMACGLPSLIRYIRVEHAARRLLVNFIAGKIASGLCVTLLNVVGFSFLWRSQRPEDAASRGAFHVSAEDYRAFCNSSGLPRRMWPFNPRWANEGSWST